MIKVLIKGHRFQHDLFELIRVFLPNKEIEFINKLEINAHIMVESVFLKDIKGEYCRTRVYSKGKLINEAKEFIVDIYIDSYSKDQIVKLAIKKSLYSCLSEFVYTSVPWGILTGIRPLKIVNNLISQGLSINKVKNILVEEYKIDESKADLMLEISSIQRKHIYPINKDRFSIYIGIPFCPSRCSYCSFPSFEVGKNYNDVESYIKTLLYEIDSVKKIMKNKILNTVYIGGGTPTAIKTGDLESIVKKIRYSFPEDINEFTVEAGRPDTINKNNLKMLKSYGINRISINPQSMNDSTLRRIGRNHDKKSTISSYKLAKDIGFDIINMDIILGLPGEDLNKVKYTLREIKKLSPENLTVHTLALKRGSKLLKAQGDYILDEKTGIESMLLETEKFAKELDLLPYYLYRQKQIAGNLENIGYSKKNMESIYNIAMMEEKETIIGIGLGAVSKIYDSKRDRIQRLPNFKGLNEYINRIEELISKKEEVIK